MKPTLEISERLTLAQILPREGNAITLIIVRHITEKLNVTPEELVKWEIKSVEKAPGVITYEWNPAIDTKTDIEFTEPEADLIRKELNKLDQQNKLTFGILSLYEKFCNPKPA
jgi:hypothetical protein